MKYYQTHWKQESPEFPVWIFSEVNSDRLDMRRLEIFANGTAKYFDNLTPLEIGVAQYPDSIEEVNEEGDLFLQEITLKEFEKALSYYDLEAIRNQ